MAIDKLLKTKIVRTIEIALGRRVTKREKVEINDCFEKSEGCDAGRIEQTVRDFMAKVNTPV